METPRPKPGEAGFDDFDPEDSYQSGENPWDAPQEDDERRADERWDFDLDLI